MGIPHKGSRRIEVDGVVYRWTIRRKASSMQQDYEDVPATIAIELFEAPSSKLIVATNKLHPQNVYTSQSAGVIPSEVRHWIQQGVALGWNPLDGGATAVKVNHDGTVHID